MSLPTDRDARNAIPLWDGLFSYFPDVWAEVAKVSVLGNKQHDLGKKLFWNREVSTDHLNKVMRHCFDHGTGNVLDTDGTFHMAKVVWRACAELQLAIEARRPPPVDNAYVAPGCELFASAPSGWATGPTIDPGDKIVIAGPAPPMPPYVKQQECAAKQDAAAKKRQESY
jgi:hypothetical protein